MGWRSRARARAWVRAGGGARRRARQRGAVAIERSLAAGGARARRGAGGARATHVEGVGGRARAFVHPKELRVHPRVHRALVHADWEVPLEHHPTRGGVPSGRAELQVQLPLQPAPERGLAGHRGGLERSPLAAGATGARVQRRHRAQPVHGGRREVPPAPVLGVSEGVAQRAKHRVRQQPLLLRALPLEERRAKQRVVAGAAEDLPRYAQLRAQGRLVVHLRQAVEARARLGRHGGDVGRERQRRRRARRRVGARPPLGAFVGAAGLDGSALARAGAGARVPPPPGPHELLHPEVHRVQREHAQARVRVRVPPRAVDARVVHGQQLDHAQSRGGGHVDQQAQVGELAAAQRGRAAQGEHGRGDARAAPGEGAPHVAAVARDGARDLERLGAAAPVRAGAAVIAIVVPLRVVVARADPQHARLAVLEAHARVGGAGDALL